MQTTRLKTENTDKSKCWWRCGANGMLMQGCLTVKSTSVNSFGGWHHFSEETHRQVTPFRENSYLLFEKKNLYLFGRTGSQLQHLRPLILAIARTVFSFSLRNLVPWPGIELGHPELGMRCLSHWITRKVPWPLLVINPDTASASLNCSQERALKPFLLKTPIVTCSLPQ